MQEDLVRWERAINEGIYIPGEVKAESDFYRLNYDELIRICSLAKKYDQDYYSVCSNPDFWERKLEYDLSLTEMTHETFLVVSIKKGYTIYVGMLLKSPLVDPLNIINFHDMYDVVQKGYYNIVKLLLNDNRTKFFLVTGTKPTLTAVMNKKNNIALLLMDNIKLLEDDYVGILEIAIRNNNTEIINHIMSMNLNYTAENIHDLFEASGSSGNRSNFELLEKYGFLLEGDNLNSALVGAATFYSPDMMKYLLDLGADPTYNNYKSFWEAYNNGELDSVKFFLDNGFIPNEMIEDLYKIVVEHEFDEMIELLDNYR